MNYHYSSYRKVHDLFEWKESSEYSGALHADTSPCACLCVAVSLGCNKNVIFMKISNRSKWYRGSPVKGGTSCRAHLDSKFLVRATPGPPKTSLPLGTVDCSQTCLRMEQQFFYGLASACHVIPQIRTNMLFRYHVEDEGVAHPKWKWLTPCFNHILNLFLLSITNAIFRLLV